MTLTFKIRPEDILPPAQKLAQAAGRGISNAVKRNLIERDRRGRADGLPRSGYYGEAAGGVTTNISGNLATIAIHKEGIALHYFGGVVYPTDGHKALAIPKSPISAGKRPAEFDPYREKLALVWPRGESSGTLRDRKTGDVVYLLVAKATIPPDEGVLPADQELIEAAESAMEALI